MLVLIALTFFLSVVCLTIGIRIERERSSPLARLQRQVQETRELSPEEMELRRPFLARLVGPIAQRVLRLVARFSPPGLKDSIRRRLQVAGNPWRAHSEEVIFAKIVLAATGTFCGFALGTTVLYKKPEEALLFALGGFATGFLLVDWAILQKTKQRRKQIQRSLPYVLDLLCVSVEAGLAFDAAMQKVTEKVEGPLSQEFQHVAYEIRIGKPRRDALRDMRDRCAVEDLNTFVAAIVQAERLGLGIGQVLRVQADLMRNLRRERAREAAMKIPVKMLFPLVFLVLPALFVVILGPAVIQMLGSLGAGGH
ncbi:MAG TPA: type II secretion system F family protein [Armatimonadetes bacterium]|jgi:tight adherence protein C|nr:type II secretion system F family protein [Armatimonadota bacterium]